jgi:hypothetical protein
VIAIVKVLSFIIIFFQKFDWSYLLDPKYRPNITARVDPLLRTLTVEQLFSLIGTDKLFKGISIEN